MSIDLTDPMYSDEAKARAWFEATIWPAGPFCPHCGETQKIYRLKDGASHRDGLVHCNSCKGSFTVMTGTVMESSHVPLNKWALAFHLMAASKKGYSALQLQRTLGLGSYRTAWFMWGRIRESMREANPEPLGGPGTIVEADETYVGGKPRKGTNTKATRRDRNIPVTVLVERGGRSRAMPVEHPLGGVLKRNIAANVAPGTEIHTDGHKGYRGVEKITGALHMIVDHESGEYAREGIHVNTAESWNALLKRGIVGSFHHVSPEHLHRYVDEFEFRWNHRKVTDTERTIAVVKGAAGKRLTYRQPRGAE